MLRSATLLAPSVYTGVPHVGSTVLFTFDEPLAATGDLAPDRSKLVLYDVNGQRHTPDRVKVHGSTVTAEYDAFDTEPKSGKVALESTTEGAVHDLDGLTNPTTAGDLTRVKEVALRPGDTVGPDLMRVRRVTRTANGTAVELVLDGEETFDTSLSAFELRMTSGRVKHALAGHYSFRPDRYGHEHVVAHFRGRFGAAKVARAAMEPGLFEWTEQDVMGWDDYFHNPYESVQVSPGGRTPYPDLEAVHLHRRPYPAVPTKATFVFDQPVHGPRADRFGIYGSDGTPIPATKTVVSPKDPRRVVATFGQGALYYATGAVLSRGAVVGSMLDGAGVPDTRRSINVTVGVTRGPDLSGVSTDSTATNLVEFHFDDRVAGKPDPTMFHVYQQDGTRVDAQQCTVATAAFDSRVSCTFPMAVTDPSQTGSNLPARLAAVDHGAVADTDGYRSPAGSRYLS